MPSPLPPLAAALAAQRHALRSLYRRPVFAFAAVASLALGLGANLAVYSLVDALLLAGLPVADPDRLVAVYGSDAKNAGAGGYTYFPISYPNYQEFRASQEVFSGLLAYGFLHVSLLAGAEPSQVDGQMVSGNYFRVLGVEPELGRTFLSEEDAVPGAHPVVVLAYGLWQRLFGADPGAVGRVVRINRHPFTVIGVARRGFKGTNLLGPAEFWVPMMMHREVFAGDQYFDQRRWRIFVVVGRLQPEVGLEQATAFMTGHARQLERQYPAENEGRGVRLLPLAASTVNPNQRPVLARAGALLMAVAALLLLVSLGGGRRRRGGPNGLLVLVQTALSLVALAGVGLFFKSLRSTERIDPGFATGKVLLLPLDVQAQGYGVPAGKAFFRRLRDDLASLPGVRAASFAENPPLYAYGRLRSVLLDGRDRASGGEGVLIATNTVDLDYFSALGVQVLQGRAFTAADREDSRPVCVINRTMAERFWPGQEAVGKTFHLFAESSPLEVVGVAANGKYARLGEEPQPYIYLAAQQRYTPAMTLFVRTWGDPSAVLEAVRRTVRALDPTLPLSGVRLISQLIADSLWAQRMATALLAAFGLLGLLLTTIGVYGVVAYGVGQRILEIGLRAALACSLPALKASRLDPADALRSF